MTGPLPHSIRKPQDVARLSRTFSQSLSAVDLAEPLLSLDATQPVETARELLRTRGIAVLGVRRAGAMAGWVAAEDLTGGTLAECAREFRSGDVLGENASLSIVLGALAEREQVFIEWLGEVVALITRRDLQKPPLRMWLFGAITLLDANMTGAIEQLFPAESWQSLISPKRIEKALALQKERDRRKSPCRLLDCLQIGDKAAILTKDPSRIGALGLSSKNEAERLMAAVEDLRNHLAHAQQLEKRHLATAARLARSIHSILHAEGAARIVGAPQPGAEAI